MLHRPQKNTRTKFIFKYIKVIHRGILSLELCWACICNLILNFKLFVKPPYIGVNCQNSKWEHEEKNDGHSSLKIIQTCCKNSHCKAQLSSILIACQIEKTIAIPLSHWEIFTFVKTSKKMSTTKVKSMKW